MGNTASTLQQPPSEGGAGLGHERSHSPSVIRRSSAREGHGPAASSSKLPSEAGQQHSAAARDAAWALHQQQQQLLKAGAGTSARADVYDSTPSQRKRTQQQQQHHLDDSHGDGPSSKPPSPTALLAPLPRLSHPHPQSHAYAFANQASLEPGLSVVHSHPFSNPASPGAEGPTVGAHGPSTGLTHSSAGRPRSGSTDLPASSSSTLHAADDRHAVRSRSVKVTNGSGGSRPSSPSSPSRRSASVSSPSGQTRSGHAVLGTDRHGSAQGHYQPSPLRTELTHAYQNSTRRRTQEGLQLGMGFDPTTVVTTYPNTPLVATQNRHASGTPSHLEPQHPSTVFSTLDVSALEHQAPSTGPTLLDRPKYSKRDSGSGTPTQLDATDPFNRTPLPASVQPLPIQRPKENEASFGIGDALGDVTDGTLGNDEDDLDVARGIAVPGTSAVTDDDTPPELAKDPLGRTLPAALPSYLRIPTTSIDDDPSLDFINSTVSPGQADDTDVSGAPDPSTSAANPVSGGPRTSGIGASAGYRSNNAVPFMAILLTWRGGGHNVSVTGTFANEWRSRIPLSRNTSGSRKERSEFSCLLHLPPGTHRLKFLVDDRWRVSPDLSTATDGEGNLVNYVEIPNVGPDHTGPLSAPGEDLPDEGGAQGLGAAEYRKGGEEEFRFPSAYLRASRLGKYGLSQAHEVGMPSPIGGHESELAEPASSAQRLPSQPSLHAREPSAAPTEEGPWSNDGLGSAQTPTERSRHAAAVESNRTSYYAESTTSSTGASSGMTASMHHHNDLKITPLDARIEFEDDRPRGSLDDVLGPDKKSKTHLDSWTHEIPENIIQAQIAEETERERLDALAASGGPVPPPPHAGSHHHHGHGHQSYLPTPPSLPRQLEKVILNSGPAGLAGAVDDNSVLPAPNHVVLSHLTASSIKGGVLAVGTTTRYKRKYVTTVFHRPVK